MNQGLSKFRSQRLRDRLKGSSMRSQSEDSHWAHQPGTGWVIGLLLWMATCALLHMGNLAPDGSIANPATLARGILLLLLGTVLSGLILRVLSPDVLTSNSRILLIAMGCLLTVLPAGLFKRFAGAPPLLPVETLSLLIPFPLAPLFAGLLLGAPAAIVAGLWVSFTSMVLLQTGTTTLFTGLVATVIVSLMAPHVRRRTQIIRIGAIVSLLQSAVVITQLSHFPPDWMSILRQIGFCGIGGIGAALVVVVSLPLFESMFGITTNITLLELSDLGHPLLQRLAFEAPGTYHHSLMVANLAHAAAESIHANTVLARVGAYFHDIGKLTKAKYFAENIQSADSPHDELTPSMSALVVMGHVKEGLSLAMLHKLPGAVMNIVEQHHGTGLAAYFHHKAGQQAQAESKDSGSHAKPSTVDESQYRYPGPRPLSRESAIIMLADSVEAASRSLEKLTPNHITELVDRLVDSRIEDGQLDECEMQLAELAQVKKAFVSCLTNMLHSRIAYPKT
jgi:putative nucleotidyltransferase with HDIG domain